MKSMSKEERSAPEIVVSDVVVAAVERPKEVAPANRQYTVLIPKSWKGPRRLVVPEVGLLALDAGNPSLQSKVVTLTDERVAQLRQNGLSVRVLGEKPGQIKE